MITLTRVIKSNDNNKSHNINNYYSWRTNPMRCKSGFLAAWCELVHDLQT